MLKFIAKCFLGSIAVVAGIILAPVIVTLLVLFFDFLPVEKIRQAVMSELGAVSFVAWIFSLVLANVYIDKKYYDLMISEKLTLETHAQTIKEHLGILFSITVIATIIGSLIKVDSLYFLIVFFVGASLLYREYKRLVNL